LIYYIQGKTIQYETPIQQTAQQVYEHEWGFHG